ncbi:acrosin-like isoform X2 [Poecile atricapillus]|uniref:acrosin-like isoform X2 n=1 Tax=Poecile atricapillus TaxID=48891 RepID=UPI0027386148|nr:acrosin-like isoform X2 [Poecile atricapillus]XP_058718128.1 acrosin-like isoform X2 [Poecile atricapillus]XP_058718129.1 acrosin-like isoform X2 [Poecile atricapillus]XP_058718130.1 acrosin-like isoform X2 [Poecile atricapillus]XP_058718131.1 acrosin-like isoform X2 [Poecile atricapillus]XP_058718132.1 acrosin-like isoform X2 [Poecile atricapillus]
MALLALLVLLALAGPVGGTWDTCRGTCGLRPMAFDHSSELLEYSLDGDYKPLDGASQDGGGTGVHPGAWPGIVSVQARLENGTWHMCSGALIHPQWVLTVAHCFVGTGDTSRWEVVIGATDLSQPGPEAELRHILRLLVHQYYNPATARNNIALLELDQPVECSDYIQLGCVPDSSLAVAELRTCFIAGWRASPDSAPGPRLVLQEAKVRLIDVQLCNSSRWYGGAVHPQDLCAGYPRGGIDTCQGDIGGPLVCKDNVGDYFWLVGLASWGRGCAGAKRPGVFTSSQHFHTWIQVQMGLLPPEADVPPPEPLPTLSLELELEPEPEPDSDFSDLENPNPADTGESTDLSYQQQILGKFLNLLLELLQFLKGKKA